MTHKHKLSDMTGYEPEAVMVIDRKLYEELLAALTNLLETIEKHTTTNKSGFAANAVAWWKQQARAVISKAEGR